MEKISILITVISQFISLILSLGLIYIIYITFIQRTEYKVKGKTIKLTKAQSQAIIEYIEIIKAEDKCD